jgi:ATP-dependent exoDNAse (exonuclease V) beta subunit
MIKFEEKEHKYIWEPTGEQYISVSQLLSKYKNPFDKEGHANRIAKRDGIDPKEVIQQWQNIADIATTKGKKIHKLLEDYVRHKVKDSEYGWLYDQFDLNLFKGYIQITAEKILWNCKNKVAGTSDLVVDFDDTFSIIDFKTNKQFRTWNKYNEYLLPPVDYLQHCEYNDYCLQLSLYAYMYEMLSYKRCRNIQIFYINEENIYNYNMPYMKLEIVSILKHNREQK